MRRKEEPMATGCNLHGPLLRLSLRLAILLGVAYISGAAIPDTKGKTVHDQSDARACGFVALRDFGTWDRTESGENERVLTSPELGLPLAANEIVVSWNADSPVDSGLEIEARALYPDRTTKWFDMGRWSRDAA